MGLGFPGHMSIILACAFNLVAGISFLMIARGNQTYRNLAHKSYHLFTLATTVAVAYLFYLFFSYDFAFQYVHNYSDSTLPFFFTLSAFWGGQEGTYLLWLFMNALFGYIIIKRGGQYKNWAMFYFSIVNFFFLFLLLKLSPFAPLGFYASEGAGLNPLLQDFWMVIHPPVIFLGYSMASIPFVIALAALTTNDYSAWIKRAFPWVAVAAFMLAAGNILGGYWAYKTLGWGGFWAWDPVENSSFIPWFISLALLHGMIIEKRTGALRKTNLLMAAFVFVLVIYGTFLTRSGVLSDFSVHSFVDLGINNYLVGFLVLYTIITLALFIPRVKSIGNVPLNYNYFGKDFIAFAGLMILFLFSIVVLFWTSLPITTGIFSTEPRAADLATYNSFALPFGIIFSLFLTVSPFLNHLGYQLKDWKKKLIIVSSISVLIGFGLFYFVLGTSLVFPIVFSLMLTGLSMFLMKRDLFKQLLPALAGFVLTLIICVLIGVKNYSYMLFFASAAMVIVSNLTAVIRHLPNQWKLAGGQLSHFGFGLLLMGILGSSTYSSSEKLVLPRGDEGDAFGRTISYQGMENEIDFPHNELILNIQQGSDITVGRPELYYSRQSDGIMRKPFIDKTIGYDLYYSPVQIEENNNVGGIVLTKGGHADAGEFHINFNGFDMGEHDPSKETMRITANLEIRDNDNVYNVSPARDMNSSASGENWTDIPAVFGENDEYSVTIKEIQAGRGAVVLEIPGFTDFAPPDQLTIDISKKPLINLVWAGTTVMLLGAAIVFGRRREESIS